VDERYRRRGAGTMLLDGLRQWAQERGADSLELNVHEFNHGALKFYRAQGFDVFRYAMKKPLR
jgi:ribosomal protein S18 acetylase RimI-like enzyme